MARVERRLAAIVAADVVGYSRLMRVDEEATLAALKALRKDVIDPSIAAHHGHIVKTMGDGLLIEFPSVVEAVRNAVEVQERVAEHGLEVPEARRIAFRVGVNVGDVIVDGGDIYGDGVNIAARLQELAEPGDICLSEDAYSQIRDKLDLGFEDIGEREVKNIDRPIRVWRWQSKAGADLAMPSAEADGLALPDKPSIAVLPFANMSGDREQEYFADGVAEDIITALSKYHWFFVIARNSSFTYKGRSVEVKQVAQELGVRYVLEGSVRKGGDRIRVTGQLIDAETGNHIWAERYDRDLEDIFAVQDEITERVITSVAPGIVSAEMQRAHRKDIASLDAWDRIMRAHWHLARFTMEDNVEARRLLTEAVQIEPDSALALGDLAMIHVLYRIRL